jgi:hypothetical protein
MAQINANAVRGDLGPMGKAMSVAGMIVGGLVAVMFILDLFLSIPFGGTAKGGSALTDIGLAICGGILAYLGWNAFRDVQ